MSSDAIKSSSVSPVVAYQQRLSEVAATMKSLKRSGNPRGSASKLRARAIADRIELQATMEMQEHANDNRAALQSLEQAYAHLIHRLTKVADQG